MENRDGSDRLVTRSEAMGMFGRMRHSTEEEKEAHRKMLERMSISLSHDIRDLPDDGTPIDLGVNVFDILEEESD